MAARRQRRDGFTYRQRRRAQSHQDALLEPGELDEIPAHPLIPAGAPELLSTSDEVGALIDHVRSVGAFAYDTEFIGELSYYPKLCLVQIATPQRLAVIDPLEGPELTPIWEAIADPALRTLVHAGSQDFEPVMRHIGRPPANILDMQIAAGFVAQPYPLSLRKLVEAMIGVRLGKALTFTQWDHRPLSPSHLRYAADDVRYLPVIAETIDQRLEQLGHTRWARAECAQLENPALYEFDLDAQCRRLRGADGLDGRRYTILRELFALRDELARDHDVPPRTLLKDELLVKLARDPVKSLKKLAQMRGMPRPIVESAGQRILDAIAEGRSKPPAERRAAVRQDESATDRIRIESLAAAASAYCLGRSIDPSLVMNRADIAQLYRSSCEGGAPGRIMEGWRRELLGDLIDSFTAGRTDLHLHWDEGLQVRTEGEGGEIRDLKSEI